MIAFTLSDWKDAAETADHLSVTLAVLIGGGWTLYTFIRLKMIANAKLDLEEKQKALHESAVLQATIDTHQIAVGAKADYYISAVVSVVNIGNTDTFIKYTEMRYIVSEAIFDSNANITYLPVLSGKFPDPFEWVTISSTVPPKYTCRIPYVFKVKKAGLYLISFKTTAYGEDSSAIKALQAENPINQFTCAANSFFVVKEHLNAQ